MTSLPSTPAPGGDGDGDCGGEEEDDGDEQPEDEAAHHVIGGGGGGGAALLARRRRRLRSLCRKRTERMLEPIKIDGKLPWKSSKQ